MDPLVSIVIPTFRRPDALRETLEGLERLDYPANRYEVIVVDDGSGDETPEIVRDLQPRYASLVYHGQENGGAARARNQGARLARGEVLIFLDDDMTVPSTLIRQHLAALDCFGPCVVCGYREFAPRLAEALRQTPFGRFRMEVEPRQEGWEPDREVSDHLAENCVPHPTGAVTANNFVIRRRDFYQLGGFDEEFPYAGYEDQEFSFRARKAGLCCLVNYGLKAWNNDRRLTLEQFCERQRRGAITAALMALKYPEEWMHVPLLRENEPIVQGDSPALVLKKVAKSLLASRPSRALLFSLGRALERLAPDSALLRRYYLLMCGLYIFRGIREGLARYGAAGVKPYSGIWPWAGGDAPLRREEVESEVR